MSAKNYLMHIAYDGRDFSGYQVQENARTVQGELEKVLCFIFKCRVQTKASGRTDAGVHALDQVVSFRAPALMELPQMIYVLGRLLPQDIKVQSIVFSDLHPRFDAVAKTYRYRCSYDDDLFLRPYALIVKNKLDLEGMRRAAAYLIGNHDFFNFSNRRTGEGSTCRNLYRLQITEDDKGFWVEFTGDGFLYKMVRVLMAYLLKVGQGVIDPEKTPEIILKKDRRDTREVAPPQGLFLDKVFYSQEELKEYLMR